MTTSALSISSDLTNPIKHIVQDRSTGDRQQYLGPVLAQGTEPRAIPTGEDQGAQEKIEVIVTGCVAFVNRITRNRQRREGDSDCTIPLRPIIHKVAVVRVPARGEVEGHRDAIHHS